MRVPRDRAARLIEAFIQSPGTVVLAIPRAVDTVLGPVVPVVLAAVRTVADAVTPLLAEFVAILHALHGVFDRIFATFPAGLHAVVYPDGAVSQTDLAGRRKAESDDQTDQCTHPADTLHLKHCLLNDRADPGREGPHVACCLWKGERMPQGSRKDTNDIAHPDADPATRRPCSVARSRATAGGSMMPKSLTGRLRGFLAFRASAGRAATQHAPRNNYARQRGSRRPRTYGVGARRADGELSVALSTGFPRFDSGTRSG